MKRLARGSIGHFLRRYLGGKMPPLLALMLIWGVGGWKRPLLAADNPRKADSAMTLVVYNLNDPESAELARFYAERRGIAEDHVVGLRCSIKEEISREEFDRDLAEPLRKLLQERGWWKLRAADHPMGRVESSEIRFVALIRGIPLRIAAAPNYEGDQPPTGVPAEIGSRTDASVDSELAVLGAFSRTISGTLQNPYYRSFTKIADAKMPALLLVCRLDAPSAAIVRRMITDSLAAEKNGLRGFAYIDSRGLTSGGYAEGDQWLSKIAREARSLGTPVIIEPNESLFPADYPMRTAAFYFGWYTEHISGPMARRTDCFVPGAIAVHIHSYSAGTLRDPLKLWCGPLLAAGAAATMGNVAEPYLSLTPHLNIFHERLRAGFTFAESGWSSERALSWMTTFIGDPLYRPFPVELSLDNDAPPGEWELYAAGAKKWLVDPIAGTTQLKASAEQLRSGVIMEGLGLLQMETLPAEAAASFAQARLFYTESADIIRATLGEVAALRVLKKEPEAHKAK